MFHIKLIKHKEKGVGQGATAFSVYWSDADGNP